MKNRIILNLLVTAGSIVAIFGLFQFAIGPALAKGKENLMNECLLDFMRAKGRLYGEATTTDALRAVFEGKGSPHVSMPRQYAGQQLSLSSCYEPRYDALLNCFRISFSSVRLFTGKPYLAKPALLLGEN